MIGEPKDADPAPPEDDRGPAIAKSATLPFPVVGIGASAGGYEAISHVLDKLPARCGMALVVIQHLDPTHESSLVELLAKKCKLPVVRAAEGLSVEVNHVYVIAPNTNLTIQNGVLHSPVRGEAWVQHMPIDGFLRSLADDQGERAIGVILSGTGSDGTMGLKAIKAEGGITFAQDHTARFDGMPRTAIASGSVDFVLPPEKIAEELIALGKHPYVNGAASEQANGPEDAMQALFQILKSASGVDFTHYKRGTLQRRIQRRMVLHKMNELQEYVQFIREQPEEAVSLYQDVLIHVTSFFREPATFQALQSSVFPEMMKNRPPEIPIRLWVPGCSTGEEVYSLAIALLEHLERTSAQTEIKIFATDVSEAAIEKARMGRYLDGITADVSPERLRRFFNLSDGGYQIAKSVRDMCVFARQDLTRDPPFSMLDLISCRNVLIYLGPILQRRVLPIFHYALKENGFLVLGDSETVGVFTDLFTPIGSGSRIYRRRPGVSRTIFEFMPADHGASFSGPATRPPSPLVAAVDIQNEVDRLVLTRYSPVGAVINEEMEILQFRGHTSPYLAPAPGAASLNILKMAREGLLLPLRDAIEASKKTGQSTRKEGVRIKSNGLVRHVHIAVTPFTPPNSRQRLMLVLFEEAAASPLEKKEEPVPKATASGEQSRADQLQQELAATRSYLQSIIEETEASNEELKAANEDSSNEELRSTNEELQTAKEELQATNEELGTVNDELRHRNLVANQLTDDLTNLLSSVNIPIVMLGRDFRIRRFTPSAGRFMNLIATDVGRPISDINSRVEIAGFEQLLHDVMESLAVQEREVQSKDGRWYSLTVRPYRTADNRIDGVVMALYDIDRVKRVEQATKVQEHLIWTILNTAAEGIITFDEEGIVQEFNKAAERMFGYSVEEVVGKNIVLLMPAPYRDEYGNYLKRYKETGETRMIGTRRELLGQRKDGATFPLELHVSELQGEHKLFTGIVRDLTEIKQTQEKLIQAERLAAIGQMSAGLAHESRNALQRSQACLEMLRREVADQPEALDLVERLQQAQNHLVRLYEETRSYAAPLVLRREPADLRTIVLRAWDHLRAARKDRDAQFHSEPGALDTRAHVDPGSVEQVFRNIFENALQACTDPCKIEISWAETTVAGQPAVQAVVRNNGPELTPEQRRRIFDPFFTTKTHGTGLGMTIVKRVIETHGGRIDLGAGPETEFVIVLPRQSS